jgi:MFS transporter, DHA1 family, tetracycline resistance protein
MLKSVGRQLSATFGMIRGFRQNARGCILTEPIWGIPFHLYTPYASLYMLALGLDPATIGLVTAIGLCCQTVWSLAAGWITDRLGRRRTSLIFDLLSWSIPTLIWAIAQDLYFFLAAAIINSMVRVVHISWTCLFVEDTDPGERVQVFTWIAVAGVLSGFFAPIAGLLVSGFGLVPAVRGLYLFACVCMTGMFILRNALTRETAVGQVRMQETRGHGLREVLADYWQVARGFAASPAVVLALVLAVINSFNMQYRNIFLSIVLNKGILIPQSFIAIFPALASAAILFIYIFIMPKVGIARVPRVLALAFMATFTANLLLYLAPEGDYLIVTASTLANAVGIALIAPLVDTVLANAIEDHQRAKLLALIYTLMFGAAAPFSYLAGLLASWNPRLPAVLIMCAAVIGFCLSLLQARLSRTRPAPAVRPAVPELPED